MSYQIHLNINAKKQNVKEVENEERSSPVFNRWHQSNLFSIFLIFRSLLLFVQFSSNNFQLKKFQFNHHRKKKLYIYVWIFQSVPERVAPLVVAWRRAIPKTKHFTRNAEFFVYVKFVSYSISLFKCRNERLKRNRMIESSRIDWRENHSLIHMLLLLSW